MMMHQAIARFHLANALNAWSSPGQKQRVEHGKIPCWKYTHCATRHQLRHGRCAHHI